MLHFTVIIISSSFLKQATYVTISTQFISEVVIYFNLL